MCLSSFFNTNNYAINTSWGWYLSSASEEGGKKDHGSRHPCYCGPCSSTSNSTPALRLDKYLLLVQEDQTGCNNIIHKATLQLPYIQCHLELINGTAWEYMANVGSSVLLCWLWRKQATENRVTLKAKQDERTIASFWEKQHPFSFQSIVCFLSWLNVVVCRFTGGLFYYQSTKWTFSLYLWCILYWEDERLRLLVCVVLWWWLYSLEATPNHFNNPPGKGILFSSEQGSIVTGKAWGFSVLLF